MGRTGKDINVKVRRECPDSRGGETCDRQRHADAERHDDDIRFGIVAVLAGVIPPIAHFRHRSAEADGQYGGDGEATQSHALGSVTPPAVVPSSAASIRALA